MKHAANIVMVTLCLGACAPAHQPQGALSKSVFDIIMGSELPAHREARQNLAKALSFLGQGKEEDARGVLETITAAPGVAGVTDEALFRLSLLNLRPGLEKLTASKSLATLRQLVNDYPDSTWSHQATGLLEFLVRIRPDLEAARDLRSRVKTLKDLNLSLTRENRELRQSIEKLKTIDLELEQKKGH